MATFHNRKGEYLRRPAYYAWVKTAFPRAVAWLVLHGEPGAIIQLSLRDTSTVFAEARIKVGGDISIKLIKD